MSGDDTGPWLKSKKSGTPDVTPATDRAPLRRKIEDENTILRLALKQVMAERDAARAEAELLRRVMADLEAALEDLTHGHAGDE